MEDLTTEFNYEDLSVDELCNEMSVSMEALEVESERLDRLWDIMDMVETNGPCRASMEALETMFPDSLPEESPAGTFTLTPSDTGAEYAMEGIWTAIKGAIEATNGKIIAIVVAIITLIIRLFIMLNDKSEAVTKAAPADSAKEARAIITKHTDAFAQVEPSAEELGVTIRSAAYWEHLSNHYNTELDKAFVEKRLGFTVEDLSKVYTQFSAIVIEICGKIKYFADYVDEMFDTAAHSSQLTSTLSRIQSLELLAYRQIPFTIAPIEQTFKIFVGEVPEFQDLFREHNHKIKREIPPEGAFWRAVMIDESTRSPATAYTYPRLFGHLLEVKHKDTFIKPSEFPLEFPGDLRHAMEENDSFVKEGHKVRRQIEKKLKEISRGIKKFTDKRAKEWKRDPSYKKDELVWPIEYKGVQAGTGQIPPGGTSDRVNSFYYRAADFPKALLSGKPFHVSMAITLKFMEAPIADIAKASNRFISMSEDYSKYLVMLQDETKAIEKAREAWKDAKREATLEALGLDEVEVMPFGKSL